MPAYPYTTIRCNGRDVHIDEIMTGTAKASHDFEAALFAFIKDWLSGTDTFPMTTSGSTGNPKRIVVTRDQMTVSARLTLQSLGLERGNTALICLSPEFIAGKMMIVRCLLAGMAIIAVNPTSHPLDLIKDRIDFTAMVPLQVHDMLQSDMDCFQKVAKVIVGGGSLDAKDIQLLQNLPCQFYATYGMTETVSHVALRQLNGEGASEFYRAMPGITFSKDGRDCLTIHWPVLGDSVATNDLVQLIDEVSFLWLGRWDNVINSGGKKIIPEKLEAAITLALQHTEFSDRFFISSIPDARLGNKVVMIIEGNHIDQNYNKLRSLLQSSLQSYEVPREFLICSRFVETGTGKVNRNATLELANLRNHSSD